jgi:hypothetical protein
MNLPGRPPGLDLEEEKPAWQNNEALGSEITKRVLEALGK